MRTYNYYHKRYTVPTMQLQLIYEAVSKASGIELDLIKSKLRTMPVATARHIARYIARTHARASLHQIADYEHSNHSSVYQSTRIVGEWLDDVKIFKDEFNLYKTAMYGQQQRAQG